LEKYSTNYTNPNECAIRSHAQKYLNKLYRKYDIQKSKKLRKDFINKNKLVSHLSLDVSNNNEEIEHSIIDIFNNFPDEFEKKPLKYDKIKKKIFGVKKPKVNIDISNVLKDLTNSNNLVISSFEQQFPKNQKSILSKIIENDPFSSMISFCNISCEELVKASGLMVDKLHMESRNVHYYLKRFYSLEKS